MREKRARLTRLLAVRCAREEGARSELQTAAMAVSQAEAALEVQRAALADSARRLSAALDCGDRGEWLFADAQREVARWNQSRLQVALAERVARVEPARANYVESWRGHEQAKVLVKIERGEEAELAERQTQADADEWFLSRRMRRPGPG